MIAPTLDSLARTASRRDSLLALGSAGLASALADAFRGEAKSKSEKRRKKKCKNPCQAQVGQCTLVLSLTCNTSSDPEACKEEYLPCCDYVATCQVGECCNAS
jgi:hypothetical protein